MSIIKHWDEINAGGCVDGITRDVVKYFTERKIPTISVLDIGANVGKLYDNISKTELIVKNYVMVEPAQKLHAYITEKYRHNPAVQIYNFALSDSTGEVGFSEHALESFVRENTTNHINLGLSKISNNSNDTKIKQIDAFEFCNTYIPFKEELNYIKIDTENRDLNIIKSLIPFILTLKHRPLISFEVNYHNDMPAEEATSISTKFAQICGYKPVELTGGVDKFFTPIE